MRIGIMLRHIDQHEGGVKVYTRELMRAMFRAQTQHEFVLFFRNAARLGRYSEFSNVQEVLLPSAPLLYWDQVEVPRAVTKYGIDVLFNPKYSIPLSVRCKTAWVCHGLDWYVMPEASRYIDRLSHRHLIPRYARKADALICVSETTRQHVLRYLDVDPDRVHTVYPGLSDAFRSGRGVIAPAELKRRFNLPDRFFLYSGAVYPPKNFRRMVQAYARVGPASGISLVIAGGTNRFLSADELREPERLKLHRWVKQIGWLESDELPALYQLAEGLLLPSLYESVGFPILEAMACGCPVLTANRYGTKELGEGAAVLVDPDSVDDIAHGMQQLAMNAPLRARLIAAGRDRARKFSWERCASQTMSILESLHEPAFELLPRPVAAIE